MSSAFTKIDLNLNLNLEEMPAAVPDQPAAVPNQPAAAVHPSVPSAVRPPIPAVVRPPSVPSAVQVPVHPNIQEKIQFKQLRRGCLQLLRSTLNCFC